MSNSVIRHEITVHLHRRSIWSEVVLPVDLVFILQHPSRTMLQWTCRFRDMLEERGLLAYQSVSKQLTMSLREAEFVGTTGIFPDDFRWEAFQNCCYSERRQTLFLRDPETNLDTDLVLVPAIDNKCRAGRYIRRLRGQPAVDFSDEKINILWLSPSVFISNEFFLVVGSPCPASEYRVSFQHRESNEWVGYCAYSLSSFAGTESYEWSTLPIAFLSHVVASLEMIYFSEMRFERIRRDCPIGCAVQFLSMFPQDAPITANCWTVCRFYRSFLNADGLRTILSHRFRPFMKLSLARGLLEGSGTLSEVLPWLRESNLRAVQLPHRMIGFEAQAWAEAYLQDVKFPLGRLDNPNDQGPLHFREIVFKSPHTSICFGPPTFVMSFEVLHAIVTSMAVTDLKLSFGSGFWRTEPNLPQTFGLYVLPLAHADSLLERLSIEFSDEQTFEEICRWMSDLFSNCSTRNLIFFNVSVWDRQRHTLKQTKKNVDRVKQWDNVLYPQLALNYCRNHLPNKMRDGVLPLMVKAVNEGIIYHKSASHIPFDTSTANAGLIFRTIKASVMANLHQQHCAERTVCALAGTKRAAP
jgi:hypothetical protein